MPIHKWLIVLPLLLAGCAQVPRVPSVLETPPVAQVGDAADDPAIWVAAYSERSRVIGTQKKGGYLVYDLQGRLVQDLPLGRPNNVDVVDGFAWAEGPAPIVVASDRTDNTIAMFRLDPELGVLEITPRFRINTGFAEVYGVCAGRQGDAIQIVATGKSGEFSVWSLRGGATVPERMMDFSFGAITEGCAVDGANNAVFVAEENRGLWRVPLGTADGAGRALVDAVGQGRLVPDVEGVSIWEQGDAGYVVVSVQGRSRFAVYDRKAPHAWRGSFAIGPGGADAVSHTDGVAVTSIPLGESFPEGLLVAQDDKNTDPAATQNFKYVSWADVARALKLD